MARSTRILIEAPSEPEQLALLVEPITETDAGSLVRQWASGVARIGPFSQANAHEIMRALRHFGLRCRLSSTTQQLGRMPQVQVSPSQRASAGRYVFSAVGKGTASRGRSR